MNFQTAQAKLRNVKSATCTMEGVQAEDRGPSVTREKSQRWASFKTGFKSGLKTGAKAAAIGVGVTAVVAGGYYAVRHFGGAAVGAVSELAE